MTATALAFLCGVINFIANLLIWLASRTATAHNLNVGIVTAILNVVILIGLFGSYFIYRENIRKLQLLGVVTCFVGIVMVSFSVKGVVLLLGSTLMTLFQNRNLQFIIYESLIALAASGTRVVLSKYCSKILSPSQFLKLNFFADFACGALVIVFSYLNLLKIDL